MVNLLLSKSVLLLWMAHKSFVHLSDVLPDSDHDIKAIFIDGILKHADITLENIPSFIETLKKISKENDVDFYVSISATNEQLGNVDFEDCTLLN